MTDEELTEIFQLAGLEPPETGYPRLWLQKTAAEYASRPIPWTVKDKTILLSILAKLEMPGMSMTYDEALELLGSGGEP